MADATYVQTNFQGGEISPQYQGRADDPDYKKSLALCLNYIPNQEGSLTPRAGFRRAGNSRGNFKAKLLPFRFTAKAPYVSSFIGYNDHNGILRLWSNGYPILDTVYADVTSVTGSPPVFSIHVPAPTNAKAFPPGWSGGDNVLVQLTGSADMEAAPYLGNREFIINFTGTDGEITLIDALTGVPLTDAITMSGTFPRIYRILDIATNYGLPEGIRQVAITDQSAVLDTNTGAVSFTPPDHRITYLYPFVSPRSLSFQQSISPSSVDPSYFNENSNISLLPEKFIDGPYFDSTGTSVPMTTSGTKGPITISLHQYDARIVYMKGELVLDYSPDPTDDPAYYMSLTDNNVGNVLPTDAAPGTANANWLQLNIQRRTWDSGVTYPIGVATSAAYYDGFNAPQTELPVYYSIHTSNTNKAPATQPTYWDTTVPHWNVLVTYAAGSIVQTGGVTYVAISAPTVGVGPPSAHWTVLPVDLTTAYTTITDLTTGWMSGTLFRLDDVGASSSSVHQSYGTDNPARLIRLKWSPQPWNARITYSIGNSVNFNDVIYNSLTNTNTGNRPDTDAVNWEIQTQTIVWTWGEITSVSHGYVCMVNLLGADLPSDLPIWEFRLGVFSDTTGWPTHGCFHEGRLYLAGAIPNRIDAGVSNQGFNFSPTAPDGAVSDNNGISIVMNSEELEDITALSPISEGVVIFTSEKEWLLAASAINDPITPTSAQVHPTTGWSALQSDPIRLPSALGAIQYGGRRIYEYRTFVDMSSYQSRLNAVDLTRKCQHLTYSSVGQIQYQKLTQPVIWACPTGFLNVAWEPQRRTICPITNPPPDETRTAPLGQLFGISYERTPDVSFSAPFSFEHGLALANGSSFPYVTSIAVQRVWQQGQEALYSNVYCQDDFSYIEIMEPLFESHPTETTYNDDGTVNKYGTVATSNFLDAALQPVGCKISNDATEVTFYGVPTMAGETVSFCILGKYVGDFVIGTDGSVTIPFTTGGDPTFVAQDIGYAMNNKPSTVDDGGENEMTTPAYLQPFIFDGNGTSVIGPEGSTNSYISTGFFGRLGYKFRRRGKMLRPQVGGQNGPTFAKTTRPDQVGIYLDAGQEISVGATFDKLVPVKVSKDGTRDVRAVEADDFVTGIFRTYVKGAYDFDAQICWEQTRPVAGSVLGVGGFDLVMDK